MADKRRQWWWRRQSGGLDYGKQEGTEEAHDRHWREDKDVCCKQQADKKMGTTIASNTGIHHMSAGG